jgi:hypothetical protein
MNLGYHVIKKKGDEYKYQRPSDWLPLPEVLEGEQKFVGLVAVLPDQPNFLTIRCLGAFTVNWGNGSITNHASNTTAEINYDFNLIPANTYCNRGYRQVVVTVTPQSGVNITSLQLHLRHSLAATTIYSHNWIDIKFSFPNLSALFTRGTTGSSTNTIIPRLLERYHFIGQNNITGATTFQNQLRDCTALQDVVIDVGANTNINSMFAGCSSLQWVNLGNTNNISNYSSAFLNCISLRKLPNNLSFMSAINVANMCSGCSNLEEFLFDDFPLVTDVTLCLGTCRKLTILPQSMSFPSATQLVRFFEQCSSIRFIPEIDCNNITAFGSGSFLTHIGDQANNCSKVLLRNIKVSLTINNYLLSREAIIEVFNNLQTVIGQTINISGNYGATQLTQADRDIAINKGWTIVG